MSSVLVPQEIIDNNERGVLQCPYCRHEMAIDGEAPLSVAACAGCDKAVMVPCKISHFWLFQQLGGGGMGMVYKAFHENHHRSLYAVKVINHDAKQDRKLSRFLQTEAQMASLFSAHPNIINLISHGWDNNRYFMAMEYVQGETLTQYIRRHEHLSEIEALRIIEDVISAIDYIVSKGYLYRDIKPENILITPKQRVYLFDFGLCLPRSVASRDLGNVVEVSPFYVPPERLTGEGEDVRSEIYSLGLVLYQAVIGHSYFGAMGSEALLRQHVSSFRLSGSVMKLDTLPDDLANVIARMIKREPGDRYQDLETLIADIRSVRKARQEGVSPEAR